MVVGCKRGLGQMSPPESGPSVLALESVRIPVASPQTRRSDGACEVHSVLLVLFIHLGRAAWAWLGLLSVLIHRPVPLCLRPRSVYDNNDDETRDDSNDNGNSDLSWTNYFLYYYFISSLVCNRYALRAGFK